VGEDQKKNKPFGRLFFHSTIQASLIVAFRAQINLKYEIELISLIQEWGRIKRKTSPLGVCFFIPRFRQA